MKKILAIVLVLALCLALFACGGEKIALPSIDTQITTTNNGNITTTVADSSDATTTTEQETTVTTAQATTTNATTTTTAKPTTQASTITKQEALKIAKELVNRYFIYDIYETACNFEEIDYEESNRLLDTIMDSLPAEQQEHIRYSILQKCTCCNSLNQAINHTKEYIVTSAGMSDWNNMYYIEYDGNLYYAMLGRGCVGYDNVRIKSYNDNHIIAHADTYGDWEDYTPTTVFTIEKIGGKFKVADVETQWPY